MLFGDIIGPDEFVELLALLCGRYIVDICGGRIRVVADRLPVGVVSVILPSLGDGVMRVVLDPEKPNAYAHTRAMLCEWWRSYQVPLVTEDGHVLLASPRVAQHDNFPPMPLHMGEGQPA